jgi:hypothetical protein
VQSGRIVLALLGIVAFLGQSTGARAAWDQLPAGGIGAGQSDTTGPAMAAVAGRPHVAWSETDGSRWHAFVARLSASGWHRLGGALNRTAGDNAIRPTVADLGGVPYVAFEEYGNSRWHIYVSRFEGGGWQPVGSEINTPSSTRAVQPRIGVVAGSPYVVWEEDGVGQRFVNVARFDGAHWQQVGASLNRSAGSAYWAQIADVSGVPYVAWEETYGGASHVLVDLFDGTAWQPVGGEVRQPATVNAYQPSLAVLGGALWVAWEEQPTPSSPWHSFTAVLSGGTWQLGGELRSPRAQNALGPNLATVAGRLYAVWEEYGGSRWHIWAARLGDGKWQLVGGQLNTTPAVHSIRPTIAPVAGFPFGAWKEYDAGNHVTVHTGRLAPDYFEGAIAGQHDATLRAAVATYGLPYQIGFLYGRGTTMPHATGAQPTSGGELSRVAVGIHGLAPGTDYSYRPFAVMGPETPPALGPVQTFTTGGPATPRIAILTRRARVDGRGRVKVRLRCLPAGLHCRGRLDLRLRVRGRAGSAAQRKPPRARLLTLVLGKRSFRIGGGHRATVYVRLSRQGRHRVDAKRRLRLEAKATVRGEGAGDSHTRRTLTLLRHRG